MKLEITTVKDLIDIVLIVLAIILFTKFISLQTKYEQRKKAWEKRFGTDIQKDWEEEILDQNAARRGKKIYIDVAERARKDLKRQDLKLNILAVFSFVFLVSGACGLFAGD